MNTSADLYFIDGCGRCPLGGTSQCKVNKWHNALLYMREILHLCGLHETCKWGVPCYMHHDRNILLLTAFKEYAALNFFNGTCLSHSKRLLHKAGEHSQSGRIYKFKDISDIKKNEKAIVNLIKEAMKLEEAGKIRTAKPVTIKLPEELVKVFKEIPALEKAYYALTPGRQRAYLIYFTGAKQSATRMSRIEKSVPDILQGFGFGEAKRKHL